MVLQSLLLGFQSGIKPTELVIILETPQQDSDLIIAG